MKLHAAGLALVATTLLASATRADEAASSAHDLIFFNEKKPILVRLLVQIDGKSCNTAWDGFLKELFKKLDQNQDGHLDKTEAERCPAPGALTSGNLVGQAETVSFKRLDSAKPADSKVSPEEFLAFYKANALPFQVIFNQGPGNTAETLNDLLFKMLDADKDGRLSKEELLQSESLLKHDLDEDEIIVAEELNPSRAAVTLFEQDEVQPQRPMRPNQPRPFAYVQPDDRTKAWRQDLQNRYGKADGRLKGKLLGREDLGMDEATFALLDKDKDGVLDNEELATFPNRPADVELVVRLGERGKEAQLAASPSEKAPPLHASLKQGKDGQLTLHLETSLLEFRVKDAGAQQAKINSSIAKAVAAQQFKLADKDNNGYLEKEEVEPMENRPQQDDFKNAFKEMDADSDGKVFEKELHAYLERILDVQNKAVMSRAILSLTDQGRGLFDLLDSNRDARLTMRELKRAIDILGPADRDGDGFLAVAEIPRTYQFSVSRDPISTGRGARAVVVRAGNLMSAQPQQTEGGPIWFRKMDRNRDGDVSLREFLGSRADFDRVDSDKDGLISSEEAQKADASLRKQ